MNDERTQKKYDIHKRIFDFVVTVLTFISKLPRTQTNYIIINQVTRSVTSMGANDQEADGASTRKDFAHGFTLVRKEGKETVYWLRLIERMNKTHANEAQLLIVEGCEIVAVVSTIIKNTSSNMTVGKTI